MLRPRLSAPRSMSLPVRSEQLPVRRTKTSTAKKPTRKKTPARKRRQSKPASTSEASRAYVNAGSNLGGIVDQLLDGYRRFRAGHWPDHRERYESLSERQSPRICVISCCDSRVDPVTIFDARPGDLFVIRNVANLVPPFSAANGMQGTSSAIEFAVRALQVELIVVLGHAQCGGVRAAIDGKAVADTVFLKQWVELLDTAKQRAGSADPDALEHEAIRVSLERLTTFPFVASAMRAGQLKLVGARFSIFDGQLEILDQTTGTFSYVDQ